MALKVHEEEIFPVFLGDLGKSKQVHPGDIPLQWGGGVLSGRSSPPTKYPTKNLSSSACYHRRAESESKPGKHLQPFIIAFIILSL